MRITPDQAGARVRAALAGPTQDSLESAVVLEAWGGLVPSTALELSRKSVDREETQASVHRAAETAGEITTESGREAVGLVATLLATTAWVAPLTAALGGTATADAWKIALPISLSLQWLLRRRHLNGPGGVARLRGDHPVVITAALAYVLVTPALAISPATFLPAALVLTWVGGLLIVVRGWGIPYALALVAATLALNLGVPVVVDIIIVVDLTGILLAAAVLTTPRTSARPTPWRRALPAGVVGGLTALLIVMDPSVDWSSTQPFPVIALVPSLLASIWAGRHLNRIWTVLLRALAATGLTDRASRPNWRIFARIVTGSLVRLVVATVGLSILAFVLLVDVAGSPSGLARLLIGLGAFGLVNFVTALLESFSRVGAALTVALVAVAAAQLARTGWIDSLAGASLLCGAAAAAVAAILPVSRLVRQPDRTIATLFS